MKLTEGLKTRVDKGTKRDLEQVAGDRHLDVSDIVREALREYLPRELKRGRKAKAGA